MGVFKESESQRGFLTLEKLKVNVLSRYFSQIGKSPSFFLLLSCRRRKEKKCLKLALFVTFSFDKDKNLIYSEAMMMMMIVVRDCCVLRIEFHE